MTSNSTITVSLPLGLFSCATISAPLPKISRTEPFPFPLDRELLDMPAVIPETDGLEDDLFWEDDSV
jgi:hypothetical protein